MMSESAWVREPAQHMEDGGGQAHPFCSTSMSAQTVTHAHTYLLILSFCHKEKCYILYLKMFCLMFFFFSEEHSYSILVVFKV